MKQPLETVALLLHIGLLGLHYPVAIDGSTASPQQQQHVSTFIRRHATSLLINLVQATVFQTAEQLAPAAGAPKRQSSLFHSSPCSSPRSTSRREHVADSDGEEDDVDEEETPFSTIPSVTHANSRHTLNLAMAPLQLSANDGTAQQHGAKYSDQAKKNSRYAKALQLINSLNQYLGWILCHTTVNNSTQATVATDVDQNTAADASCPVLGLDYSSLISTLVRVVPAPLNAHAFVQAWFNLTVEWSTTCTNDAHFTYASLRLMDVMAGWAVPKRNMTAAQLKYQPNVQHEDLLEVIEQAECDLRPWLAPESDLDQVIPGRLLSPHVLSQTFSTCSVMLAALVGRDEAAVRRYDEDWEVYQHTLPRLFWMAVRVVRSATVKADRPSIASCVVMQALDFASTLVGVISRLSYKNVDKSKVVEWIWMYATATPRPVSADLSGFNGLQDLCHQLLLTPAPLQKHSHQQPGYTAQRHQVVIGRVWSALAQLSAYTQVNDEHKNVVASLIDPSFVSQLHERCTTPSVTLPSIAVHPFLLNLTLHLPSFCLSLQSPPLTGSTWKEVSTPSVQRALTTAKKLQRRWQQSISPPLHLTSSCMISPPFSLASQREASTRRVR